MKIIASLLITALAILFSSCGGGSAKSGKSSESDSTFTADSIVKYYSNNLLLKEVTFKNGERNGITKTYYQGGQLYQTFWYVNGLREDSVLS